MRSIELFTGAGGLALGTHRAGFHHLAVVERDHDACATLRLNRGRGLVDWPIEEHDVTTFAYAGYPQGLDLLAGGAPCQPFSLGGKHAGEADTRNMFPHVFRAVRELHPRAFLLENVKGLTRASFRPYFAYLTEQLCFPHVTPLPSEGWEEHQSRLVGYHAAGGDCVIDVGPGRSCRAEGASRGAGGTTSCVVRGTSCATAASCRPIRRPRRLPPAAVCARGCSASPPLSSMSRQPPYAETPPLSGRPPAWPSCGG